MFKLFGSRRDKESRGRPPGQQGAGDGKPQKTKAVKAKPRKQPKKDAWVEVPQQAPQAASHDDDTDARADMHVLPGPPDGAVDGDTLVQALCDGGWDGTADGPAPADAGAPDEVEAGAASRWAIDDDGAVGAAQGSGAMPESGAPLNGGAAPEGGLPAADGDAGDGIILFDDPYMDGDGEAGGGTLEEAPDRAHEGGPGDNESPTGPSGILDMESLEGAPPGNAGASPRKGGPARDRPQREPLSEEKRQLIFTCGCVVAAFCGIVFVLFGAVFAMGVFQPQIRPALASSGDRDTYYDADGRMHVNVYISRQPGTEVTLYVLPDGTVTTEEPDGGAAHEPVTVYVGEDGSLTKEPPAGLPQPDGTGDGPGEPGGGTGADDADGEGTEGTGDAGTVSGTGLGSQDGGTEAVPDNPDKGEGPGHGSVSGTGLGSQDREGGTGAEAGPDEGGVPGTGSVSGTGLGSQESVPDGGQEPGAQGQDGAEGAGGSQEQGTGPGTVPDANAGAGMTEPEILEAANARDKAGQGFYLDTDTAYTVQAGDTLSLISGRTGFSVDFLAAYNRLADKNLIITGESLRYPSTGQ